ncbi:MAG: hypothetical protein GX751_02935, partial [Desulfuromonadaceae bacterium]|nr:hypothetical protein [Desulfuromonadaceae bacterium]
MNPTLPDLGAIRIPSTAPWLPLSVRERLRAEKRLRFAFAFSAAERKILRKPKPIRVSEWSEKHRVLTLSSLPGPWSNAVTPYLAGIMDAAAFASVETVIVCKGPQTGVSEAAHNFIGHAIDTAPGPVLYVYPDETTSRENSRDRVRPMIESSPCLNDYLTGIQDDKTIMRINLRHMPVYFAWATSASRLANKPIRYLIEDELDKYPETSGSREASPMALAEKRTITYRGRRKIWKISTPTVENGPIWQALQQEAQIVFDYQVHCPACGAAQIMTSKGIVWPQEEKNSETVKAQGMGRYRCPHCQADWDDAIRDRAVSAGSWISRDNGLGLEFELQARRPLSIGFHLPAWLSHFVALSEVAAARMKAKRDKIAARDYCNNFKAEPWVDFQTERQETRILLLRDERPSGLVPREAAVLTLAADTQKRGFWYEVRAWGYGLDLDSWQIRHGFVETFDALARIAEADRYLDAGGNAHMVEMALIDSGGGEGEDAETSRTVQVYDFCRLHPLFLPVKGQQRQNRPYKVGYLDTYPGGNR